MSLFWGECDCIFVSDSTAIAAELQKQKFSKMKNSLKAALEAIKNNTSYKLEAIKIIVNKDDICIYSQKTDEITKESTLQQTYYATHICQISEYLNLGCFISCDKEGYCYCRIF